MVRLLVSVRDVGEALCAGDAGADFIDLKEPADGALGALEPERIAQIVAVLRSRYSGVRISATVGDLGAHEADEILRRVARVASCGVDYVKVGLWPTPSAPALAAALLDALAACAASVVPVLVADRGIDPALVAHALECRAFPALMVDTADKARGSLLQRVPRAALESFIAAVRSRGTMVGLAGSLRVDDVPALRALAPDFAGFRGALTRGERSAALDARLVQRLRSRLAPRARARSGLPAAA
jgi:(5-formylfuran-3-yl)methyl phosphate synthase